MDDGWEKIRKEVTCSVCLKIFEEPKMLPCLHTFCAKCLQTLWQQADAVGVNRIIHCPQCREKVQLSSVQELQPSFSVFHLLEIVDMQDRLSRGAPPTCQSCIINPHVIWRGACFLNVRTLEWFLLNFTWKVILSVYIELYLQFSDLGLIYVWNCCILESINWKSSGDYAKE